MRIEAFRVICGVLLLGALLGCEELPLDVYRCQDPDPHHVDATGRPDPCHRHDAIAEDAGAPCLGICLEPLGRDWTGPDFVWVGDEADAPPCPASAAPVVALVPSHSAAPRVRAPASAAVPRPPRPTSTSGIVDPGEVTNERISGAPIGTVGGAFEACHGNELGTLKEVVSLHTGRLGPPRLRSTRGGRSKRSKRSKPSAGRG